MAGRLTLGALSAPSSTAELLGPSPTTPVSNSAAGEQVRHGTRSSASTVEAVWG